MSNNLQINTNKYLHKCDSKDIISLSNKKRLNVQQVKNIVYQSFYNTGITSFVKYVVKRYEFKDKGQIYSWFFSGEECNILKAGSKRWQKGKLRINITIEFIPDKVEEMQSPLDDIRQEIYSKNL